MGTHELAVAYRDCFHLLIEPIVEWNERIEAQYVKWEIAFELVNVAASNFDGLMNMETCTVLEGLPISHACFSDKAEGTNIRRVQVRQIDTLLSERNLQKPYLLKVDVDGAELLVPEGAKRILPDCNVVIVEVQTGNIRERMLSVLDAGFELFDIVDPCYYDGRLWQVDLIFLNQQIANRNEQAVIGENFDVSKWECFK